MSGELAIRQALKDQFNRKTLSAQQISDVFKEIISGQATPAQTGAFLTALQFSPLTSEVMFSAASAMSSFAVPCDVRPLEGLRDVLDIVGTGGDLSGFPTFNASTAAATVVAACGVKVAKHGNRSSGRCGSADFIEALGAKMDLKSEQVVKIVDTVNFSFLFAQNFHPCMGAVASIRRELGVRTIFNWLGPLINPVKPNRMLLGVGTPDLGRLYAEVFLQQHSEGKHGEARAFIVHSDDGMDEISPAAGTHAWIVQDGNITETDISPETFGLPRHPLTSVESGTPPQNAATFRRILAGEGESDPTLRPVLDFILMNSAVALWLVGKAISSGAVRTLVEKYIQFSNTVQ
ncbi:anthranilate phosphoribosyltransferase [Planoprotostelium fungivorum]|uniref:Anthranilate phosphoribosyltransferase n=1 Tax=Planoprotostelium fungivorum TaxID=1890364 RepID=A0A2P6NE41_9EUKA|nr:anthranilate phosphoribosyltransferase [Planoprotostelium fungivorum]